jgi:cellulose synthase/poly-beta-1,6-N-acetylglucosamine synthase-like glycosyltransferase
MLNDIMKYPSFTNRNKVSVVWKNSQNSSYTLGIAAYNEERTLPKTVPKMLEQLKDNELIIVACGEETIKAAKSFKDQRIRVIEEHKREGKAAALNKIFSAASNDIIVLTDADVLPKADAFGKLTRHFEDDNVGCVSGRVIPLNRDKTIYTFFSKFAYDTFHAMRMAGHKLPTGYLYAVRKSAVSRVPDCYSEDALIGAELNSKGWKFVYEPEAEVGVLYPTNLRDFFTQKVRTRYGHLEVRNRYGLEFSAFRPRGVIRKVVGNYGWKDKIKIGCYAGLEALAWVKAWMDFRREKGRWERVWSSKTI